MYQNSQNTPPSGVKLKYTLSANQYGTLLSGEENIESNKCYVKNKNTITFDENTNKGIKKQLEDAQDDTTAQNWALGTSNTIEGRLSYTAESTKDKVSKILNKKDIKVYFVASKSCPVKQILTCESTTLIAKTCINPEEGGTYDCYCNTNNVCYLDSKGEQKTIGKPSTSTTSTTSTSGTTEGASLN